MTVFLRLLHKFDFFDQLSKKSGQLWKFFEDHGNATAVKGCSVKLEKRKAVFEQNKVISIYICKTAGANSPVVQ